MEGPEFWGPEVWEGAQNFAFIFLLLPQLSFFSSLSLSLEGLLAELWSRFKAVDHLKCAYGLLWGHFVRAPGGSGVRGSSAGGPAHPVQRKDHTHTHTHALTPHWPKTDWTEMDWPKLDLPKSAMTHLRAERMWIMRVARKLFCFFSFGGWRFLARRVCDPSARGTKFALELFLRDV